ncbi:MAG TPA: TAXI family TRAP transporter solute-binding subunit [Symbiobacteriaceae bacterium]|nr:TAXI family TRAP transporter solute-binding subunit [Symbiobacteriaceae bacterium]
MRNIQLQKLAVLSLSTLLAFSLLVGCSPSGTPAASGSQSQSQSPAPAEQPKPQVKMPKFINIGAASTGGAYYPIGIAMAKVISDNLGTQATAQVTGGAVENVKLIQHGNVDIAISIGKTVYSGFNGLPPYDKPHDKVRALFGNLSQGVFHIVTMNNSSIKTVADLKGKRVVMGPAGGGGIDMAKDIFGVAGFTLDDIKASYISYEDGVNALKDGQTDAVIVQAAFPAPAVAQLAATKTDFRIVTIDDELMAKVTQKYPFYHKVTIPDSAYGGIVGTTVYSVSIAIASADLPDDVAYAITKTLFENEKVIQDSNPAARSMSVKQATAGVAIPYHPGAEKYLKEKGVLE